jgi:hypothetical protein
MRATLCPALSNRGDIALAKSFTPAILTANHLAEGYSVFLAAEGWSRRIDAALVALTPEQAEELAALGSRFVEANEIVGPYLVDVALAGGAPVPLLRRERIRADGRPTIALGTLAEAALAGAALGEDRVAA